MAASRPCSGCNGGDERGTAGCAWVEVVVEGHHTSSGAEELIRCHCHQTAVVPLKSQRRQGCCLPTLHVMAVVGVAGEVASCFPQRG